MSTTLRWKPHAREPEGESLPALKNVTGFGGAKDVIGPEQIPYLQGIIAGSGSKSDMARDAKKLIEAIEKHGEVDVWVSE